MYKEESMQYILSHAESFEPVGLLLLPIILVRISYSYFETHDGAVFYSLACSSRVEQVHGQC